MSLTGIHRKSPAQAGFVELLRIIATASNEATTIEEAMQTCLDSVCALTEWPVGHFYILANDAPNELAPTSIWHFDNPELFETFRTVTEAMRMPSGIGLPGRVLESGKPAWITDVMSDPNFPRAKMASDLGIRAGF